MTSKKQEKLLDRHLKPPFIPDESKLISNAIIETEEKAKKLVSNSIPVTITCFKIRKYSNLVYKKKTKKGFGGAKKINPQFKDWDLKF